MGPEPGSGRVFGGQLLPKRIECPKLRRQVVGAEAKRLTPPDTRPDPVARPPVARPRGSAVIVMRRVNNVFGGGFKIEIMDPYDGTKKKRTIDEAMEKIVFASDPPITSKIREITP